MIDLKDLWKKILILLHPLTNLELETLTVLSVTSGNISIASFSTVIGAPVGIASVRLGFEFPITIGIVKDLFKWKQNNKNNSDEIVMLEITNKVKYLKH